MKLISGLDLRSAAFQLIVTGFFFGVNGCTGSQTIRSYGKVGYVGKDFPTYASGQQVTVELCDDSPNEKAESALPDMSWVYRSLAPETGVIRNAWVVGMGRCILATGESNERPQ